MKQDNHVSRKKHILFVFLFVVRYLMVSKASGTTGPGDLCSSPLREKVGSFKASSVASRRKKPVCESRLTSQGQVKTSEVGTIQLLWILLFYEFSASVS